MILHCRSNLAALDEGRPFHISPDDQLFDQCGVGQPSKQSAGHTAVLSAIRTRTKRGEELRESAPRRSHPRITTKDQNIGKYGYIGNWILRKYRKYRKYQKYR